MLEIILSWPGHFPAHYNADAWNSSLSEGPREREILLFFRVSKQRMLVLMCGGGGVVMA